METRSFDERLQFRLYGQDKQRAYRLAKNLGLKDASTVARIALLDLLKRAELGEPLLVVEEPA